MGKKKERLSLFSTIVQQISPNKYNLIDNEYFPAFNSLDDADKFHQNIIEKQQEQSINVNEESEHEINYAIDMKSFAQEFLIDLPEHITTKLNENHRLSRTSSKDLFNKDEPINWSPNVKDTDHKKRKSATPIKRNSKKLRRNLEDDFMANDETFSKLTENIEKSTSNEFDQSSIIKDEPIDSEQIMTSAAPMEFNTSKYSGGLDTYVQNIHLLQTHAQSSSRSKRIRKQNKFYIDESESVPRQKKLKTSFRKKHPSQVPSNLQLTDAEIEQQFGERLPIVKQEHGDDTQQILNSQVIIEFEPIPQTSIEKARAKLVTALGRGHDPDAYVLKIRSREHKIIEIQLAIYSTTDWYSHRTKILSKIEEALRGLRVSWTKIDIHVDDYDVQISTSSQTSTLSNPSSVSNTNSSWFLKTLSESGALIVHIHDRRYPQQRFLIKCSCPECSSTSIKHSMNSSLPIIVNVSPCKTPARRLTPPSILNKTPQTNISASHNIKTTFFNELICQYGKNVIISVTQCVLDLALVVSVHTSLPDLYSSQEFKKTYQQIIDPLHGNLSKLATIPRTILDHSINNTQSLSLSQLPDILTFYNSIKENKANIRSAKSMRNLIQTVESTNQQKQSTSNKNEPVNQLNTLTTQQITPSITNSARVIRFAIAKSAPTIRILPTSKIEAIPLVPKQINIIKPLTSSITPAVKLSNPILISKSTK